MSQQADGTSRINRYFVHNLRIDVTVTQCQQKLKQAYSQRLSKHTELRKGSSGTQFLHGSYRTLGKHFTALNTGCGGGCADKGWKEMAS